MEKKLPKSPVWAAMAVLLSQTNSLPLKSQPKDMNTEKQLHANVRKDWRTFSACQLRHRPMGQLCKTITWTYQALAYRKYMFQYGNRAVQYLLKVWPSWVIHPKPGLLNNIGEELVTRKHPFWLSKIRFFVNQQVLRQNDKLRKELHIFALNTRETL